MGVAGKRVKLRDRHEYVDGAVYEAGTEVRVAAVHPGEFFLGRLDQDRDDLIVELLRDGVALCELGGKIRKCRVDAVSEDRALAEDT